MKSTRSSLEAERQAEEAKQAEIDAQVKKLALLENKLADRDRDFLSLEGKCHSLESQVSCSTIIMVLPMNFKIWFVNSPNICTLYARLFHAPQHPNPY